MQLCIFFQAVGVRLQPLLKLLSMEKTIETWQQMFENLTLVATESQFKEKLEQFNNIDLDDENAVDMYLMELRFYKNCLIIPDF
jgi:hypothetical protein